MKSTAGYWWGDALTFLACTVFPTREAPGVSLVDLDPREYSVCYDSPTRDAAPRS
ncbi:MAG: hypothetical protein ABJA34_04835 [Pseudonocardiales bacterium]